MFKIEKLRGLVAAPFTPMDANGSLNTSIVPEYYSFLAKNGIAGAFINGTTGEGVSLTQKEKQRNAVAWSDAMKSNGKMRVINLVGGTCYEECIENAIQSKELGLSAISVLAPYYFKPDEAKLAEFVTSIGETVPELPVYFYHIPVLTGVNMPMAGFMKRISVMLPNFAGIKYTQEDFMDFFTCMNYDDCKYDLLWGRDECLLSALVLGCRGAVGSTYNYAAPLYYKLIAAFDRGDMDNARELQLKSINMISLLGKYGGIATGKAYMKFLGFDCGKYRLPVRNMTDQKYDEFVRDVKALGMKEYFSTL
jgi:N-acetylneuraminate lyase